MNVPQFRGELLQPAFPLFDCHVHLGPSDTDELYYPHLAGDEYLNLMTESGVAQACAFAPLRETGYQQANQQLADWAATTENRVLAFARLGGRNLPITQPELWMLRRKVSFLRRGRSSDLAHLDNLQRFAGVKLLPHLDGLPSAEEFARIAELRLPVLVHCGRHSSPAWIAQTILPKLRGPLIMAHLGAFPCEEALLHQAVALAKQHAQLYLDTSGAWVGDFIRYAVREVPEKIVFGSDAPLAHPLVAWYQVASVVLDDRLLERIGRGTAQKIFQDTYAKNV